MKINYPGLFVKAIIFALVILALKSFFNGIARADEFTNLRRSLGGPCAEYAPGSNESIKCLMGDLNNFYKKNAEQRKKFIEENKQNAKTNPIAEYTKGHYVEAPRSNEAFLYTPAFYGSINSFVTPQTHYNGVIHGPNVGDWYTFEAVGN